ncbi:MAG: radical SAM protein [Desulfobulbaceae bacterium]|nr:radical SAM protein [Desulfobulbaceae bacterium]
MIIPIFIPHEGCPHCCSFCNQHQISGRIKSSPVDGAEVCETIETWLGYRRKTTDKPEVAFYGGSFTGLPLSRQTALLRAVQPFIEQGRVGKIRLSTRPDYINEAGVDLLQEHGVRTVELGVQSMNNDVLTRNGRGHSAENTRAAIHLLRRKSMNIGVQLMTGLIGDTRLRLMDTVKEVISLKPDCVRIYPVLVLKGSLLEKMTKRGEYQPLTLDGAIIQAAWMKKQFDRQGITVLRMGLQAGEELENSLIAGPYHPAFGELVNGRLMLKKTIELLHSHNSGDKATLCISPRDRSVFQGIGGCNIKRLTQLGVANNFILTFNSEQPRLTIVLSKSN